ncbi:hypothetical protein [Microbacterium sp. K41]|uniref:hypothetical protein n=1 Tax=Microbacterium sp. K41 TaxID=2305437 RepID=UPI00109CAE82|nr:hypothetical protein [Microbacterium sp. K41]
MRPLGPRAAGAAVLQVRGEYALPVTPMDLHTTPPRPNDGGIVVQLRSSGLGGSSYVVAPAGAVPSAIVLEYGDGRERHWRRGRGSSADVVPYVLVDDSGSTGYVTENSCLRQQKA